MKRDEILAKMRTKEPRTLWYPMQLGCSGKQLRAMDEDGLISSRSRYSLRGGGSARDYYLTQEQYDAIPEPVN